MPCGLHMWSLGHQHGSEDTPAFAHLTSCRLSVGESKLLEKRLQAKLALRLSCMLKNFSLPAAVVLGCCSFEAYNAPYKSYGLKEVSPCGTEVIYMDADFLSGQISGVLEVSEPCCHSKRGRTPTQSQVYNDLKVLLGVLTYIQDVQSC